ncbi:hypothetical protein [Actinomadura yumaensis]|uniref:Uncharacterized protein n=1 Tax=Actinomadura yumaensis TaxID=111807 RepID=A0ABW2CRW6_9ACTN
MTESLDERLLRLMDEVGPEQAARIISQEIEERLSSAPPADRVTSQDWLMQTYGDADDVDIDEDDEPEILLPKSAEQLPSPRDAECGGPWTP